MVIAMKITVSKKIYLSTDIVVRGASERDCENKAMIIADGMRNYEFDEDDTQLGVFKAQSASDGDVTVCDECGADGIAKEPCKTCLENEESE